MCLLRPLLSPPRRDNPSVMDYIRLKAEVVDLEKQASECHQPTESSLKCPLSYAHSYTSCVIETTVSKRGLWI